MGCIFWQIMSMLDNYVIARLLNSTERTCGSKWAYVGNKTVKSDFIEKIRKVCFLPKFRNLEVNFRL